MRAIELSVDATPQVSNRAAEIRDAVLSVRASLGKEACRSCVYSFDKAYDIGQEALRSGLSPIEALAKAQLELGKCCRGDVSVEPVIQPFEPTDSRELVFA